MRLKVAVLVVMLAAVSVEQEHKMTAKAELTNAQYIAQVTTAAPAAIAKDATVVRGDEKGEMKTIREGKNGYTCMIAGGNNKMCADANAMEFFGAYMKHENPPDKLGLAYMLAGDDGASNTDPF